MNNRRKLLVALCAGALAAPFGAIAQQKGRIWRIGYLWELPPSLSADRFVAFTAGMRELGYAEGTHYVVEQRSAQTDLPRLPALAAELVALKVDVIVVQSTPAALAARNATREIPIVTTSAGDPVGNGLAASLRHPGGNVTGLSTMTTDLYTKRLHLLHQIVPGMRRAGLLYNPDNPIDMLALKQFETDCSKLGFKSIRASVGKKEDVAAAFNLLKRDNAQGVVVSSPSLNLNLRDSIIEHAARYRLPAVYGNTLFPDSGGLLSYSASQVDMSRRAATYVDKIFKGAQPGELPIEQPMLFEMVLNKRTAKALGIKIPNSILAQATKVIE
jgi:putative ABC transport system substrate-binding protein